MNTILVWVLVINVNVVSSSQSMPVISQPMDDVESCQRIQKSIKNRESQCVQIKVVVPK